MTHSRNWLQLLGESWRLSCNPLTICLLQGFKKPPCPPLWGYYNTKRQKKKRGPFWKNTWSQNAYLIDDLGNSLAVQWLGLSTFTARAQVQSLVRELRSHKLGTRISQAAQHGQKKKIDDLTPSEFSGPEKEAGFLEALGSVFRSLWIGSKVFPHTSLACAPSSIWHSEASRPVLHLVLPYLMYGPENLPAQVSMTWSESSFYLK